MKGLDWIHRVDKDWMSGIGLSIGLAMIGNGLVVGWHWNNRMVMD